MISILRAADRQRTDMDGITTWHCFSSGAHYDPANVSFGPVIACDEHQVAPGAGFDRHAHARVELVSWVLGGALCHEDASGRVQTTRPGQVQYQFAGAGIEHVERNASTTQPLHFVQLWLLTDVGTDTDDNEPAYEVTSPPRALQAGRFAVLRGAGEIDSSAAFVFVGAGRFSAAGHALRPGDSLRARSQVVPVTGAGELLVITVGA